MASPTEQLIAALRVRVQNMVARGFVSMVDDAKKMQEVQLAVLAGEAREKVERFQQYGITSHPFQNAEALALFLGGNREHGICIAVDDRRYRLKGLAEGEVALYDDLGNVVHLKRDEVLVTAVAKARVSAPAIVAEALSGAGTIQADATTSIVLQVGTTKLELTAATAKLSTAAHSVLVGPTTVDVA